MMSRVLSAAFLEQTTPGRRQLLVLLLAVAIVGYLDNKLCVSAEEELSTPEPDASPGCKAPDIRFTKPRMFESTPEPPYVQFETTQIYLPEDFTTSDIELVERIRGEVSGGDLGDDLGSVVNPYQIDLDEEVGVHDDDEELATDSDDPATRKRLSQMRKLNKKRRSGSGRRRRIENVNGQSRGNGGRGSRYKRQAIIRKDTAPAADADKWSGAKLAVEGDVYYVHIEDLLKSRSLNNKLRQKLHKMKKTKKATKCPADDADATACVAKKKKQKSSNKTGVHTGNPSTTIMNDKKRGDTESIMMAGPVGDDGHATITEQRYSGEDRLGGGNHRFAKDNGHSRSKQEHHRHRGDNHKDVDADANGSGQSVIDDDENGKHFHHNNREYEMGKRIAPGRMRRSADDAISKESSSHYDHDNNSNFKRRSIDAEVQRNGEHHTQNNFDKAADGDDNEDGRAPQQLNGRISSNIDATVDAVANFRGDETSNRMAKGEGGREEEGTVADQNHLQRVKRKSGKTTGALSRPKGGGDSGSKTTSRKDKGIFDEEGGYSPVHPDEGESEEEEEEEQELDEIGHFTEVSEIRFPGEVGPLGDRRLCKIRCVKGKWVGPLCATNEEDDHGNIKFQPLYKSCHVNRIPPHLLLSYRNISVNVGWDLPHGHSLQARCKDLGLYKLLGESRVLCSNGLWAPRMPSCVPTTLLTNFSDDSAPSIRIKIGSGSGAFEPSGILAVLPSSTIHLDCMYPRQRGTPEWTWTSWYMQYNTGWSTLHEEKSTKYRLTIKDIQNNDSGTFTCTSPRGLTNSIAIIVATSTCPRLPEPVAPLSLRLEGNKLGQRALYRCPQGYRVDGSMNSTCLASGNWSSPPPTCQAVQCPRLNLEDSHLSLMELNTSAWGRAVFKCQWGFKLNGPPGLECEPSGVWSGPVPRCRAIQCPTPLVPLNGRIGGTSGSTSHRRYAVGALVTFSCNDGHILVGEASIVCTETGFWSHPPPFCKSQCPYPGDPPNGLIAPLKFNYDSGDYLSVQCRPGFVEYSANGPPERPKCLPDGNWSGPVPQCRSYEDV